MAIPYARSAPSGHPRRPVRGFVIGAGGALADLPARRAAKPVADVTAASGMYPGADSIVTERATGWNPAARGTERGGRRNMILNPYGCGAPRASGQCGAAFSQPVASRANDGRNVRSVEARSVRRPVATLGSFEPGETWIRIAGTENSDVTADTAHFRTGTQGLRITSRNAVPTYAQRDGLSLDISAAHDLQYDVYADASGLIGTICIFLMTDDDNYFYTFDALPAIQLKPRGDGWHRGKLNVSSLKANGSPSLSRIAKVLIQICAIAGNTARVSFDSMLAMPPGASRGKVTIRFDDGLRAVPSRGPRRTNTICAGSRRSSRPGSGRRATRARRRCTPWRIPAGTS